MELRGGGLEPSYLLDKITYFQAAVKLILVSVIWWQNDELMKQNCEISLWILMKSCVCQYSPKVLPKIFAKFVEVSSIPCNDDKISEKITWDISM